MKNILAALLSCIFLFGCFAFSVSADEPIVGGWSSPESPEITPELQEVFEKATEGILGVTYTPVALVGTQVVAGMNYCFLCEAKAVVPEVEPYYVNVTVYQDLSGKATVTNIEGVESHSSSEIAAYVGEPEADGTATEETQEDFPCCCCCKRQCCRSES